MHTGYKCAPVIYREPYIPEDVRKCVLSQAGRSMSGPPESRIKSGILRFGRRKLSALNLLNDLPDSDPHD